MNIRKPLLREMFPKRTETGAEREGRFWRLTGITREWIVNECNDDRKADILRGWDRSQEAGEVVHDG